MNEIDMPQAVALQCNHSRCPDCTPAGYQLDKTMEAAAKANTELRKTLRDHFAMAAPAWVTAPLTTRSGNVDADSVRFAAHAAYRWADAMMNAREEGR